MKEIHVVGAAILDGDKVLAGKRSESMRLPLKWEYVGGKVEKGETYEEALEREVFEELGIKIEVKGHVADGFSENEGNRIILHVYEAAIRQGKPFPKEHARLEWIGLDRLDEYEWAEPDIAACRELNSRYVRHNAEL